MFALFIITMIFSVLTALLLPSTKAQRGSLKDFTFPQVNDGDPIAYLVGRVKITAPGLTWYGDFASKDVKKATGLFTTTTVGYKYFLGWQLAVCLGPDVVLKKLWFGQKTDDTNGETEEMNEENDPDFTDPNDPKVPTPIFDGSMTTGTMQLTDLGAFGGSTGGGGYDLNIEFYGGESSQPASAYLGKKTGGFVPPYKGLCHLVVHGYIGNSTQLQTMTGEFERIFDVLELADKATIGDQGDANPANVIYELLTNNFGAASVPLNRINTDSFTQAGITFFNEDEGISIAFGGQSSTVGAVIQDILRQVDGVLYEDPEDNNIYLKLIRLDYDVDDLLEINESNILAVTNYATNLWSDTKNRVRVKYEDRSKDYDDRTAVGEDMANVNFQGGQVKAINVDHPYIKRAEHANRKVATELAIYSTPIAKVSVATQRITTSTRPGSVIKMTYGPYKLLLLVLRVTKVSYGDLINNRLTFELTGDKFSKSEAIFAPPITNIARPFTGAPSIVAYLIDETPRWFNIAQINVTNPDAPRIMVYPFAPTAGTNSYNLWSKVSGEADYAQTNYEQSFAELASSLSAITQTGSADIILEGISDPTFLAVVTDAQIQSQGLNLIQVDGEIMAYDTYELVGSAYHLQGIQRGLLDTVRAPHAAGAYMTFLSPSQVGTREFGPTDLVDILMGSISAGGEQSVDQAAFTSLTLVDRAARPLHPVAVTFDGSEFNPTLDNTIPVVVVWKRRDRLKTTISFESDADEAPEAGTEYFVRYGAGGSFTEQSLGTGTTGTFQFDIAGANSVEIYAKLDGLDSYQHIQFMTNVLHADGISVSVDFGAAATTVAQTVSQASTITAPMEHVITGAPTVTVSRDVAADGDLGTATTDVPTISVSTGVFHVDIGTVTTDEVDGTGGTVLDSPGAHRYWRFSSANNNNGNSGDSQLSLIEGFTKDGYVNLLRGGTASADTGTTLSSPTTIDMLFNQTVSRITDVVFTSHAWACIYDLGSGNDVDFLSFRIVGSSGEYYLPPANTPADLLIEYSDDETTWTTFGSASSLTWAIKDNAEIFIDFGTYVRSDRYVGNPWGAYTKWRIQTGYLQTSSGLAGPAATMSEVPGGPSVTVGGTPSARDTFGGDPGTYDSSKLFDNDATTLYSSSSVDDEWVQYIFTAPVSLAEFSWTARNGGDEDQSPMSGYLQFYDGVGWTCAIKIEKGGVAWTANEQVTWTNAAYIAPVPRQFMVPGEAALMDDGDTNSQYMLPGSAHTDVGK